MWRGRGLTSKLHEIASSSCILIKHSQVLLMSDSGSIFLINFTFPTILCGWVERLGRVRYEKTVVRFALKYEYCLIHLSYVDCC